jgi:hypothetical protein
LRSGELPQKGESKWQRILRAPRSPLRSS